MHLSLLVPKTAALLNDLVQKSYQQCSLDTSVQLLLVSLLLTQRFG